MMSLAFNAEGNLISASRDGMLKLWTIPPAPRTRFIERAALATEIAIRSPLDRSLLAVDLAGDILRVWEAASLQITGQWLTEL